jgi:hypothetical protein
MRRVEPEQYYYPLRDLHLTAFEISHSVRPEEAEVIANRADLRAALSARVLPSLVLHSPEVMFRDRGAVFRFEPVDGLSSPFVLLDCIRHVQRTQVGLLCRSQRPDKICVA